jgi:hypothetical protein
MPEQILINGNTYTLGATAGPISGTGGSTTYFFGNLTPGRTYYFAVVAYNYAGYSGYAGPISIYTPPALEESRPVIYMFGWNWPHETTAFGNQTWNSTTEQNIFPNSADITNASYGWANQGLLGIDSGKTDPFGGTGAFNVRSSTTNGDYSAIRCDMYNLDPGNTYVVSFWMNVSGATMQAFRASAINDANTGPFAYGIAVNQLLPTPPYSRSPSVEQSILYPTNPEFTGWQRFAYEFHLGTTQPNAACHLLSHNITTSGLTWSFYGPQLVKGTTTINYVGTTAGGAAPDFQSVSNYYANDEQFTAGNPAYVTNANSWLAFGPSYGISYCYGLVNPFVTKALIPGRLQNSDKSNYSKREFEKLKNLPIEKRALQPNLYNFDWWHFFQEERLAFTGWTFTTYYLNDPNITPQSPVTNYYANPWPITGISAAQGKWHGMLQHMKNSGVTGIAFVFMDEESNPFQGDVVGSCANIANSLISGNPKYSQSIYGLTSWKNIYEGLGGFTQRFDGVTARYDYLYSPQPNWMAWAYAAGVYDAKIQDLVVKDKLLEEYPDATISNYNFYKTETGMCAGPPDINGHPQPKGAYVGNATSPVLYGYLGGIVAEFANADVWSISEEDPTRLDYYKDPPGLTLAGTPWTSFLQAMGELRAAKRNAPNVSLTPWIGAVSWSTERSLLKPITWDGSTPSEVTDWIINAGLCGTTAATAKFWKNAPTIPMADVTVGYNSREHVYYTERGGNSAYFFELVRHIMLHGTKGIGWFNPTTFIDYGLTGVCLAQLDINNSNFSSALQLEYFMSGVTHHVREMKELDDLAHDVFDHIGGFTLTTADSSKISWKAEWVASGAPGLNGTTWWWRITGSPDYLVTVDGNTVLSATGPGMWLGTTGPTLGVEISSSPVLGAM